MAFGPFDEENVRWQPELPSPPQAGYTSNGSFVIVTILVLECFALPTQFYLLAANPDFTLFEAIVRFFSFFTILTNALVAFATGVLVFGKSSRLYNSFRRGSTFTAVTVYIVIVGLVYNLILRQIENLEGIRQVLTEIFHTIVPMFCVIYWSMFLPKREIGFGAIPAWMIYPLCYVAYTLLHGMYTGFYPYPFVDVNKLGYAKSLANGAYVLAAFIVVAVVFVIVAQFSSDDKQPSERTQAK